MRERRGNVRTISVIFAAAGLNAMDRLRASRQCLAEGLRNRSVVPVIGPEAVIVDIERAGSTQRNLPLYDLVAQELLKTYDTRFAGDAAPESASGWQLHRAVAQVLSDRPEVSTERVRRSVAAAVNQLAEQVVAAPLLDRLAALGCFDLFVCVTPDNLLVSALRRRWGEDAVDVGVFAPSNDTSTCADVPPGRAGRVRVFFPMGRVAAASRVAIHEEDALEYFYRFQEDATRRAPILLDTLRQRDLMMLGCHMPEWLGLGFIRLANVVRLSSQDKKMEFFAADARSPSLNAFLGRFNPNATVFPWTPAEFVDEVEALATEAGIAHTPAPPPGPSVAAARAGPTVFVSYASEDRDAARRLADGLLAQGFSDVWLDRRKLKAGDDWSLRIDEALASCDFFVPVLSLQADRRREGVFWEEWRKAIVRAMRVKDAFLLPVGVDGVPPDRAGYERIFGGFSGDLKRLQLVHAPDGQLSPETAASLRARIAESWGDVHG